MTKMIACHFQYLVIKDCDFDFVNSLSLVLFFDHSGEVRCCTGRPLYGAGDTGVRKPSSFFEEFVIYRSNIMHVLTEPYKERAVSTEMKEELIEIIDK